MNITIYKNPEGGYEFSGTRSDGQTINGSVDTTQKIEQFIEQVENTKTADELKEERKTESEIATQMAIVELYEMILGTVDEPELNDQPEELPAETTGE